MIKLTGSTLLQPGKRYLMDLGSCPKQNNSLYLSSLIVKCYFHVYCLLRFETEDSVKNLKARISSHPILWNES